MFKNIIRFNRKPQGESHQKGKSRSSKDKVSSAETLKEKKILSDVFMDASTILSDERLSALVRKIRVASGVSNDYFDAYYLPVIYNCAAFCQSASASKDNHHSFEFGLITHLLETTIYAMRSRLQFVYKVTTKEEDIDNYKNLFTYAVFVSAMNHDMGKLISDNRFFIRKNENDKYIPWSLLSSYPPAEKENIQYKVELKINKAGKRIYKYNSHSIMNTSLLCRTVPSVGWEWITSMHPKVETDIYHAVAGDYDNSDVIGKAVKHGDSTSSSLSMKNKVANLNSSEEQSPLLKIIQSIILNPEQHSLTVNNTSFTTLVKKDGLIYISGSAFERSVKQEAKNHSFSLPSNSNKIEGMITDHFTLPAASGDSMWWVTFSPTGVKPQANKKDIKCFVFDGELYDPEEMLPDAESIDIHLSIKSLSEGDRSAAVKVMAKEATESEKLVLEELNENITAIKNKNSNLSIGGAKIKSPLGNIKTHSEDNEQADNEQAISSDDEKNTPSQVAFEPIKKQEKKFKPSTVKGSDILNVLNSGAQGSKNKSKKPPATTKTKSAIDKPSAVVKEKSAPTTKTKSAIDKPSAVVKEKPAPTTKTESAIDKPSAVVKEKPLATIKNKHSVTEGGLKPPSGVGSTVSSLLPSFEDVDSSSIPVLVNELDNGASSVQVPGHLEHNLNQHTNNDKSSLPNPHDMSDVNYNNLSEMDLEIYGERAIPDSMDWVEMDEDRFVLATQGPFVNFVDEAENKDELPGLLSGAIKSSYAKPKWADQLSPKESDLPFMRELFGVLQQAINNGLLFNRIGAKLYVVPHGIFLVSPSAFEDPDFPLSTRNSYYKDNIRNSSYLALTGFQKGKTIVTGRMLNVRKGKGGRVKVKNVGALNGFYIVTGSKLKLTYNGGTIPPTRNLIFDHYSVNGILK